MFFNEKIEEGEVSETYEFMKKINGMFECTIMGMHMTAAIQLPDVRDYVMQSSSISYRHTNSPQPLFATYHCFQMRSYSNKCCMHISSSDRKCGNHKIFVQWCVKDSRTNRINTLLNLQSVAWSPSCSVHQRWCHSKLCYIIIRINTVVSTPLCPLVLWGYQNNFQCPMFLVPSFKWWCRIFPSWNEGLFQI